jgi:hypothetical protein
MNSKFPSAMLPIKFNTPLASNLLGRRLVEMEGTSLMSLSVIESLHQGGRKPWHIKITLFGLYLINHQPHLSIFESF